MDKLTVVLDVMGGDNGPEAAVGGALLALSQTDVSKLFLVGQEDVIDGLIKKAVDGGQYGKSLDLSRLEVVHAPEIIGTDEVPTVALKAKKNSSIVVGLNLVKEGKASAFVSAGSTGAVLAGGTTIVGRIRGIKRPALGVMLPSTSGFTFLTDSGANVDAKPEYLLQFAQMGSIYMSAMMGVDKPRVGLVNVGAEREKGNAVVKEAHELLESQSKHLGINFVGNVEGRDIPLRVVDVAVCDAFVGNVILKYAEGFAKGIMSILKEELMAGPMSKIGAMLSKSAYKRLRKRFDYNEVGGAPFIGLNGLVVKAHGSSNEVAIKSAIGQCTKFIQADVPSLIRKNLEMLDNIENIDNINFDNAKGEN